MASSITMPPGCSTRTAPKMAAQPVSMTVEVWRQRRATAAEIAATRSTSAIRPISLGAWALLYSPYSDLLVKAKMDSEQTSPREAATGVEMLSEEG